MKFETLTYSASAMDYSIGGASAPHISGRSEIGGEAVPNFAAYLWAFVSCHILAYFARVKARNPKAELVMRHVAPGETSDRLITVTLNRRLRRKLARLQRLGRVGAPELAVHEPGEGEDEALSETQFLEKMIRTQKWCRVRVFGLGLTRRALRKVAVSFAGLQGAIINLQRAMVCKAPISPD